MAVLAGCKRDTPKDALAKVAETTSASNGPTWVDVTTATGLDFRHENGQSGKWYFPELVGAGVALFDFDQDGDLDLFLVQGTRLDSASPLPGPSAAQAGHRWHHALFRNEWIHDGKRSGTLRWTDISGEAGLKDLPSDYGMGVAVGDFDNDGFPDLYITNFGPNRLLRNDGGRRLVDITTAAGGGLDDPRWSVSASWFDYDRDGWLDLVCCNYTAFTFENHRQCYSSTGAPDYCGPQVYRSLSSKLWRNKGNGTFEDMTASSGLLAREGAGLGIVTADFNNDGWPDIFVANDGMANHLWLNDQNGQFRECGLERGCALNGMGATEANMGIAAADFDDDGDVDIMVTHLDGEKNTLFENWKNGWFSDVTAAAGLDGPTRPYTGFGTAGFDYDLDGWLDLISANGAVRVMESQRKAGLPQPFLQHVQLFRGRGAGKFIEVTNEPAFRIQEIGRGLATGDIDNDGDADVVLSNNQGPARVVLNNRSQADSWLGLELRLPSAGGRAALGANVRLELSNGRMLHRRCASDGSYASSSEARVLFGWGRGGGTDGISVRRIVVNWPNGTSEFWTGQVPGRYHVLVPGSGTRLETAQPAAKER